MTLENGWSFQLTSRMTWWQKTFSFWNSRKMKYFLWNMAGLHHSHIIQWMIFLHGHEHDRGELFKYQVHVCIEAEVAVKTLIKEWMQEQEISQSIPFDGWFFMAKLKLFNKLEKEYCPFWPAIVYYILKELEYRLISAVPGTLVGLFSICLPLISACLFRILGPLPVPDLIHTAC